MEYDKLQRQLLKSMLINRDWELTLNEYSVKINREWFTVDKYRIIFDELIRTEGNIIELRESPLLKASRVVIDQLFLNEEIKVIIDIVDETNKAYKFNKTISLFRELRESSDNGFNDKLKEVGEKIIELSDNMDLGEYDLKKLIREKVKKDLANTGGIIGYKLNRFKDIETRFNGIQKGLTVIGARENVGKSVLVNNLIVDLIRSNEDVYCLYFSLDDDIDDNINTLTSLLAESRLERNEIKNPNTLRNSGKYMVNGELLSKMDIFTESTKKLINYANDRLIIMDTSTINSYGKLIETIKRSIVKYKEKKIVVFVDAYQNLDIDLEARSNDENTKAIAKANLFKQIADANKIPLIITTELRKGNGTITSFKAPVVDDIAWSSKLKYNAKAIMLLSYNDMVDTVDEQVYFKIVIAKNKFGSFKTPVYVKFERPQGIMSCSDNYKGNYEESIKRQPDKEFENKLG